VVDLFLMRETLMANRAKKTAASCGSVSSNPECLRPVATYGLPVMKITTQAMQLSLTSSPT
jgi:hypothetical protein